MNLNRFAGVLQGAGGFLREILRNSAFIVKFITIKILDFFLIFGEFEKSGSINISVDSKDLLMNIYRGS